MSELITAWRRDTGERVQVPQHWFDTDLGTPFTRTDPAAAPPSTAGPALVGAEPAPTASVSEARPAHKSSRKES